MQFLLIAHDAQDDAATERRMLHRDAHLANIAASKAAGNIHFGAALLDDDGKMIGSSIVAEFPTREELDAWIVADPYVTGGVWATINITPCKIAPSFAKPE